jgi:hypothetical protein
VTPLRRLAAALALAAGALLALAGLAAAEPRDIRVGAFVTELGAIDQEAGTFRIGFWAWFVDPAGTFDPVQDMYVIARDYTISEVQTGPAPEGGVYTTAFIEAEVDQSFDLDHFPFDRQRLGLRLEAAEQTDAMRFVPDAEPPQVADYLQLLGWRIEGVTLIPAEHGYSVRYGLGGDGDQNFSQITLAVDVERHRSTVIFDDFIGFTFAFLITALTFVVPCSELGLRVGMTTGSLFAAVVNLNRLLDEVGFRTEFGLVDRLAFLIFGAILTSLVISISTHKIAKRRSVEEANRLDTWLGAINLSVFLAAILWTLRGALA